MAEICVTNVDDEVLAVLAARAAREGRNLASLIGETLAAEAMRPRREMFSRVTAWHEELTKRYGKLPHSP